MTPREALDRTLRLARDAVVDSVSDDEIVQRFQSLRVRCSADEATVSCHSGQTTLVSLISLIARMGVQVVLDVPDVELLGPQPPLQGDRLRPALIDLGDDLVPGTSITGDSEAPSDVTFVVGDTPAADTAVGWRLTGTGWAGSIAEIGTTRRRWDGITPIGGMTAAALAAPEVFKTVVRTLPLRHPIWNELLAPCRFASWDFEGDGLVFPTEPVTVDIISAGAITQAALFALIRLPIRLVGRIFDDDVAELSNVNRQVFMRRSDTGSKVDIVAGRVVPHLAFSPVRERLVQSNLPRHSPLANYVLVGVDDIPARWDVQRAARGWLGVGGTTHFGVSTSSHEPGQPCAGCLHFRDDHLQAGDPIPTVSFVSFWAGLAVAVRLLRCLGGRTNNLTRQHLWLSTLRMDEPNGRLWRPIPPRTDCPVGCRASGHLLSA